jgi:hypothetical protein
MHAVPIRGVSQSTSELYKYRSALCSAELNGFMKADAKASKACYLYVYARLSKEHDAGRKATASPPAPQQQAPAHYWQFTQ